MGKSYVYWTVHHLDSWVKRDQPDVTCFIISLYNVQHISDVNTSILRSLRLVCWVISWVTLIWFDVCWSYVVVWLWWCGIHMQVEALALYKEIIKQVTSSWSLFTQRGKMFRPCIIYNFVYLAGAIMKWLCHKCNARYCISKNKCETQILLFTKTS